MRPPAANNVPTERIILQTATIHAQPGETVTVYNSDQLLHRIVADDGRFFCAGK